MSNLNKIDIENSAPTEAVDNSAHATNDAFAGCLSHQQSLELVYSLHASLDIKAIIKSLAQFVAQGSKPMHVYYKNTELNISVVIGDSCLSHVFSYRLCHSKLELGEIQFSSETAFDEHDILFLEECLCFLVTPLHNAVEHTKAVQSAMHDPLTGVGNRIALARALDHELALAKRQEIPFTILAIDIDDFKAINDDNGHLGGDAYLQFICETMGRCMRESDQLFRNGGEEFCVVLSATDTAGGVMLADKLRKAIADTDCQFKDRELNTTISVGVASFINGDTDMSLLERADEALYRAKQYGRNRVCT